MKRPGLQHEARLKERLDRMIECKFAYMSAKRDRDIAQETLFIARAKTSKALEEFDRARQELFDLVHCDTYNNDGLPNETPAKPAAPGAE